MSETTVEKKAGCEFPLLGAVKSSFDRHHFITVTSLLWLFGVYVCMLPTFLKNYRTELHEIFRDDLASPKDQSNRFWE